MRNQIRNSPLFDVLVPLRRWQVLRRWSRNGMPAPPPPYFKQDLIKRFGREFGLGVLVETGTYRGDMVKTVRHSFRRIYSIELDHELWQDARERFSGDEHIQIIRGDSGKVLPQVLDQIDEAALFWLDAHAMTGHARADLLAPVEEELNCILNHPIGDHVVLIDDARLFIGSSGYPTTETVRELVHQVRPEWDFVLEHDIMRMYNKSNRLP